MKAAGTTLEIDFSQSSVKLLFYNNMWMDALGLGDFSKHPSRHLPAQS